MLDGPISRVLLGRMTRSLRPGMDRLVSHRPEFVGAPLVLRLTSPAFHDGDEMPARFTDDGAGVSPPLAWTGVPEGAKALALLVEDADPPGLRPLVHLIVPDLPPGDGALAEGELPNRRRAPGSERLGRNSFAGRSWLPPSPPPEHGPHRYTFQLFALDERPLFRDPPGRSALVRAMEGHVIGRGLLVGTYERR